MPVIAGDNIDKLCSLEFRPGDSNIPRGIIARMYEAARARAGAPLSTTMGQAIIERVKAGDNAVIFTGAGSAPYFPKAEIDGIPGAAAIARALTLGLGARVHIAVEPRAFEPMIAALRAAELNAVLATDDGELPPQAVVVHGSPIDEAEGRAFSDRLLDELAPSLVLAIEKLSESHSDGRVRGATGWDWHDTHFKPQYVFEQARARGILTAGIGDGGNEVGYGSLPEAVDIVPSGKISAAATATDHLWVASVSDWGGYGLSTILAILLKRPEVAVTPRIVERMLDAVVLAGAVDGLYARPITGDDGYPLEAQTALAMMLQIAISQTLLPPFVSPGH